MYLVNQLNYLLVGHFRATVERKEEFCWDRDCYFGEQAHVHYQIGVRDLRNKIIIANEK